MPSRRNPVANSSVSVTSAIMDAGTTQTALAKMPPTTCPTMRGKGWYTPKGPPKPPPARAGEDAPHHVPDDERQGMAYAKGPAASDQQGRHEQQSGRGDGGHDVQSAFLRAPGQRHPQDHASQCAGVEGGLNEAQNLAAADVCIPGEVVNRHTEVQHHGQEENRGREPDTAEGAVLHGNPEAGKEARPG